MVHSNTDPTPLLPVHPHHITSHHITSHHITSHHITSHHITSHHTTPHHTTPHHTTPHHTTPHHTTPHHTTPHHTTPHHNSTILQNAKDELADALLQAERRVGEAEQAAADTTNTKRNRGNNKKLARGDSLQADLEILLREIDQERKRSDDLEIALETASADVERAILSLCAAAGVAPPPPPQEGEDGGDNYQEDEQDEFDVIEAAADIIKNRISVLKASRDKLIAALDSQSIEMDKLGTENSALQGAVLDAQLIAEKWAVQVQASLVQNELLKDLLEESASWDMPSGGGGVNDNNNNNNNNNNNREETNPTSTSSHQHQHQEEGAHIKIQNLERQLLKERAKTAELDLAARALCAELTRVSKQAVEVERCMVPILGNVETRLAQMITLQPRPGTMADDYE
jgi:hypothetical protein